MALVLGLKEGEQFRVGPHDFRVHKIRSERRFVLCHEGAHHEIDDIASKTVATGISIMCGKRGQRHLARVWIEADRDLRITRVEAQPAR